MRTTALGIAGFAVVAYAIVQTDARAYLWAPGVVLLVWWWARLCRRPDFVSRPGYIFDQESER